MLKKTLFVLLINLCLVSLASASTITVRQNGTGDFTTIGLAIDSAVDGDVIDVGPGNYPEQLTIDKSITLEGSLSPGDTVLNGMNSFRPIEVTGEFQVTIRGFHFYNGWADNGSAVFIWHSPTVLIENCLFTENFAYESNTLHIRHTGTAVRIRDCEFRRNTCNVFSAAIGIGVGGYLLLEDSIFVDNVASGVSGAINCSQAYMDVYDCVFIRNSSSGSGAIHYFSGGGTVSNNTFFENSGTMFGSVYVTSGVSFADNIVVAEQSGPGITAYGAAHDCNLFYKNAGGPIVGSPLSPHEFISDPLFCDVSGETFALCSISVALPHINGCRLMGAFEQGCLDCEVVGIELETWGSLKSMFR